MLLKLFVLTALLLVSFCFDTYKDSQYGFCVVNTGEICSKNTQKYGICCSINNSNQYFKNVCLACQGGCEIWGYALQGDGSCSNF